MRKDSGQFASPRWPFLLQRCSSRAPARADTVEPGKEGKLAEILAPTPGGSSLLLTCLR